MRKIALYLIGISLSLWGVELLLFPEWVFSAIGGAKQTALPIYSRYSGAWFLAVGIAAFLALNANHRVGALFELCMIGAGLSALALMFDFFSGTDPFRVWFTWLAIINALAIVVTSYMARQKE